jgi:hypothetical protein
MIYIYLGWGGLFANLWQPSKFYVGMSFFWGRTTCPPLTQNVKISQQTNRWVDTGLGGNVSLSVGGWTDCQGTLKTLILYYNKPWYSQTYLLITLGVSWYSWVERILASQLTWASRLNSPRQKLSINLQVNKHVYRHTCYTIVTVMREKLGDVSQEVNICLWTWST